MKIMKKIEHPYLVQFEKLSATPSFEEYIAVHIDQFQKDIKEVLIEFIYNPARDNYLDINKVYTTNEIKFVGGFNASDDFYYLYYDKDGKLFLLPARQPNSIQIVGEIISLSIHGSSLRVLDYTGGTGLVVNDIQSGRNKFVMGIKKPEKALKCVFNEADDYTVSMQMASEVSVTGVQLTEFNYQFTMQSGSMLMIILIVCGSVVLLAIVGIAVGCYIRKRKSNQQNSNAQLL
jgi:hypothetical protein